MRLFASLLMRNDLLNILKARINCGIMKIFKKVSIQDICEKGIIMVNITEKDWRLFKVKLPCWQERHMARLNEEYIKILSGNGLASEKFWEIERRIERDKRNNGVITEMKRSNVYFCLVDLLKQKIITTEDLHGFSEELVDAVTFIYG